jgi:sugar phosphate permease
MESDTPTSPGPSLATLVRIFVPFALGYFLSYLYRAINAVIAPNLTADVDLNAADLGLLTSTYFLTFAFFQLTLGVLLDRFGPRRTEAVLLLFAATGAFVFASAHSTAGLIVGRALVGLGVSACLMAAFKAFVLWFPSRRLPLVNGLQMAAGGLGALAATTPVEAALQVTTWRGVFMGLGICTLVVAGLIFLIVPERRREVSVTSFTEQIRGIGQVFTSSVFWRIAPWTVMAQAAFLSILGLWVGPWLRDVAGLERGTIANYLAFIAMAMIAGFVLMGAVAERLSRRGVQPMRVAGIGMVVSLLMQAILMLGWRNMALPTWMLFGFFGTTSIIPYAVLSQSFPAPLVGRVITGLNLLVFTTAFACQWGIGVLINLWPTTSTGGYAPPAYQAALAMMLALQVAGLIWYLVSAGRSSLRRPSDTA